MLAAQFYLDATNQPYGYPVLVTPAFCHEISRASGRHSPDGVANELRQGYTIAVPGGFYMAADDWEGR
jgi:hypothetical protein